MDGKPKLLPFCISAIIISVDERSFVKTKQDSWNQLSEMLEQLRKHGAGSLSMAQLESLGVLYRKVISDLAFARSQGASERLILFLNDLAGRAHGALYASENTKFNGMAAFLLNGFPVLFRSTFKYTLAAALLFFAGWTVAAYILYTIPDAWNALVPESVRNIMQHSPSTGPQTNRSIFIGLDPAELSGFIMTNNIKEGMKAFAGGITFGIYSVWILLKNGVVIGAIITIATRLSGGSLLLPLLIPHGIIELTAVFVCGGAGLMIGSAMIAPGNIRRTDSIRIVSLKALKLFIGTLPLFVIAALIEGFITPAAISNTAKLTFGALTVIGLVIYLGFAGKNTQQSTNQASVNI